MQLTQKIQVFPSVVNEAMRVGPGPPPRRSTLALLFAKATKIRCAKIVRGSTGCLWIKIDF